MEHQKYLIHALNIAKTGQGSCSPNPSVGCIIVKNKQIIAATRTSNGGRPHAEFNALQIAGNASKGANIYVTLEPCSHYGKTPPCVKSLIKANVAKVFYGLKDPDKRVNGRGVAILTKANISCEYLPLPQIMEFYRGFIFRNTKNIPNINLKIATSLDGKIALANGKSKWITGELARNMGRKIRSIHDGILTGIGTILADNPDFSVRLNNVPSTQPRIILDSNLRTPKDAKILQNNEVWIITKSTAKPNINARIIKVNNMDFPNIAKILANEGLNDILLEAGARLNSSAIKSGLISKIYWFRAASIMGINAINGFNHSSPNIMENILLFKRKEIIKLNDDILEIYGN